jgi:hypothetical protein
MNAAGDTVRQGIAAAFSGPLGAPSFSHDDELWVLLFISGINFFHG